MQIYIIEVGILVDEKFVIQSISGDCYNDIERAKDFIARRVGNPELIEDMNFTYVSRDKKYSNTAYRITNLSCKIPKK